MTLQNIKDVSPVSISDLNILTPKTERIATLTLISTILCIIITWMLIGALPAPEPDLQWRIDHCVPIWLGRFTPEPLERYQYLATLLLAPIFLLSFYTFFRSPRFERSLNSRLFLFENFMTTALLLTLILSTTRWADEIAATWFNSLHFQEAPLRLILVCFVGIFLIAWNSQAKFVSRNIVKWICNAYVALLLIGIFYLFSFRIVNHLYEGSSAVHFNAVFHAMSAVFQGKAILIDTSHQYGLWPHFLEPFFQLWGLSTLRFLLVMGALILVSLGLIYHLMVRLTNHLMAVATLSIIVLLSIRFLILVTPAPPHMQAYFQYIPLRMLFPVLGLYFGYLYFQKRTAVLYATCLILASMAVLWNLDSGAVVFVAWVLALCYSEFAAPSCGPWLWRKTMLGVARQVGLAAIVLFSVVALFTFYMRLRYGAFPDFLTALNFQSIFYAQGFFMLPMPTFAAWNFVGLVYLIGLFVSCRALVNKDISSKNSFIFFVTILGCGLFSYYQGRSHFNCLLVCVYPAIILAAILSYDALVAFRAGLYTGMAKTILTTFFLLCAAAATLEALLTLPDIYKDVPKVAQFRTHPELELSDSADFLRSNLIKKSAVLIISNSSGIYHVESDTVSPLRAPGYDELIFRDDWDEITRWLEHPHPGASVVVDPALRGLFPALKNYSVRATSPNGKLSILDGPN